MQTIDDDDPEAGARQLESGGGADDTGTDDDGVRTEIHPTMVGQAELRATWSRVAQRPGGPRPPSVDAEVQNFPPWVEEASRATHGAVTP